MNYVAGGLCGFVILMALPNWKLSVAIAVACGINFIAGMMAES